MSIALSAGMNFGVYLYSYAFNSAEAQTEAQFAINALSTLSQEAKALMTYPVASILKIAQYLQNLIKMQ